MIEFADRRSITGRTGALTVVGPVRSGRVLSALYSSMKRLSPILQYPEIDDLRQLHALRFTVVEVGWPHPIELLVFETVFNGDWEQYLLHLVRMTSKGINMQATGSVGYPGSEEVRPFMQFLVERHRPAAHVYAANPMLSPTDCRQLIVREPMDEGTARWWGVIVPVRPGATTELIDLCSAWTNAASPFAAAAVHHGRIVVIERPGGSDVLISAVYRSTSEDGSNPYVDDIADARDRELLTDMVAGSRAGAWIDLLGHTTAFAPSIGDAVDALLTHRMVRRGPTTRWVDAHWRYLPSYLKNRAATGSWLAEADLPNQEPEIIGANRIGDPIFFRE